MYFMARGYSLILAGILLAAAQGCATPELTGTGGSVELRNMTKQAPANSDRGTLFLKVFIEEPNASTPPTDIQIKLDGKEIVHRSFSMGRESYDGQYQIKLPNGRHTLEVSSQRAQAQKTKKFYLNDTVFIEVYITDKGQYLLSRESRQSIARFVIKKSREARGQNSNRALWMMLPSPRPEPGYRGKQPSLGKTPRTAPAVGAAGRPTSKGKP